MRVMISQAMAGLTEAEARKNRGELVEMFETQGCEAPEVIFGRHAPKKLLPSTLLSKLACDHREIFAFISDAGREIISGKFAYNIDTCELISSYIDVVANPMSAQKPQWICRYGAKSIQINPLSECQDENDKIRFINEASKIFIDMRDLICNDKLKTRYINQLRNISYQIDNRGRYVVNNFQRFSIASLYAIASIAIT